MHQQMFHQVRETETETERERLPPVDRGPRDCKGHVAHGEDRPEHLSSVDPEQQTTSKSTFLYSLGTIFVLGV